MKLGSLKKGGRDGTLIVASRDLKRGVEAGDIAPSLREALENWADCEEWLQALSDRLNDGKAEGAFDLDANALAAPLPRAWEFLDGSAYLPHVERVRKARGAEVPDSFYSDPLMYQATAAGFLGPRDPIQVADEGYGIDLEAEVIVVTDAVAMGASAPEAGKAIRLVGLVNDVSLRGLIPAELKKGFGFLQGKPRSALSPVFVTPDELDDAWQAYKLHLPMRTWLNGKWLGEAECGEDMQFDFGQLVAHAARTRPLEAGTIVGSGTIANEDTSKGASCLAEQRTVEKLRDGEAKTPFLKFGDSVKIEVTDQDGQSIFGAIEQTVAQYKSAGR
ncbi:MAG: fumarylacetoacetate hydrolase family protein [Gammaproteobacteria bacterium]|nr:fumarylacetoacetate hydrolase family protein [Gammaproteobacteria bacterium]